jgi:hypothetical protein
MRRMQRMCNTDIRNEIKKTGIYHWQVADALGVAENTFCRMLRKELPDEKKKEILRAIRTVKAG